MPNRRQTGTLHDPAVPRSASQRYARRDDHRFSSAQGEFPKPFAGSQTTLLRLTQSSDCRQCID